MIIYINRCKTNMKSLSPAVNGFSLLSFLPEQVEFQLNFCVSHTPAYGDLIVAVVGSR